MKSAEKNLFATTKLIFNKDRIIEQRPLGNRVSPWGTSNLLLYLAVLQDLENNRLTPTQEIVFSQAAAQEGQALRGTRATEGEKRLLIDVLNQAISLNAPDCIMALFEVYGSRSQGIDRINQLGNELEISFFSRLTGTGRKIQGQLSNVFDYYKIGVAFLNLSKSSFQYIANRDHVINGQLYPAQSVLDKQGMTLASIFWGTDQSDCFVFYEDQQEVLCSIVINGASYVHTSQLAFNQLPETSEFDEIEIESPIINFLGDTYFGEYFTDIRRSNRIKDALQEHGYAHSMANLATKMPEDQFNIVTYEGVLTKPGQESTLARKVFLFGGDEKATVGELAHRNTSLVNLGTNHSMDFGDESLGETIDAFTHQHINTIGAGKNLEDALRPIVLTYNYRQKTAIFSGYWYRRFVDENYDFYANKAKAGVAALNGLLLEKIKQFKKQHPDIFVTVLAHWGNSFENIHEDQREIAQQLVAAGTDLILGTGPHKVQPIEEIDGTTVVYSMGNGVFNSDGEEFKQTDALPYGYFLKWDISNHKIQTYPFNNYNPETFWQPSFIKASEPGSVFADLKTVDPANKFNHPVIDQEGYLLFEFPLNNAEPKDENHNPVFKVRDEFSKLFEGYFLNENLLYDLKIDHISFMAQNIKQRKWQNVAFLALTPESQKALVPANNNWQPVHGNQDYMTQGISSQVSLIVTDEPIQELANEVPQFIVPNTLRFVYEYASMAAENYKGELITITGSTGKTSTRLMLSHLLKDKKPFENTGNANLHLPTLNMTLELASQPKVSLFEVAASALNGLAYGNNAYLWESEAAIFTSFGSSPEAKGDEQNLRINNDIFKGVKNGGYAIINADIDEKYLWRIIKQAKSQNLNVRLFSLHNSAADCYVIDKIVDKDKTTVSLLLSGKFVHFTLTNDSDGQIQNALSVLLTLDSLGYDVKEYTDKLESFRSLPRVLETIDVTVNKHQVTVLDDTYSSSTEAAIDGIKLFTEKKVFYAGKKFIVLGQIADFGRFSREEHLRLLPYLEAAGADKIYLWGEAFEALANDLPNGTWFKEKDNLVQALEENLDDNSFIYIKGSHASRFYEIVDRLKSQRNVPFTNVAEDTAAEVVETPTVTPEIHPSVAASLMDATEDEADTTETE
ncbi:CapA family protein [Enterococcus sp. LJL90]